AVRVHISHGDAGNAMLRVADGPSFGMGADIHGMDLAPLAVTIDDLGDAVPVRIGNGYVAYILAGRDFPDRRMQGGIEDRYLSPGRGTDDLLLAVAVQVRKSDLGSETVDV